MIKTDRQLLIQAANAIGMLYELDKTSNGLLRIVDGKTIEWNPLECGSDALDLAASLTFDIRIRPEEVSIYGSPNGRFDTPTDGNASKAVKRAITRAAADVGRALKKPDRE